ncbi:hypothetical protein BWI17_05705 [Betaproteobacteria bacterium GR16-43]|nr:hypothetical protein BWI17_05705 [Betaproteobacteria bacterium GR16-43]
MKNDAYQNTTTKLLAAVFIAASTLVLSSCGGGGAAGNPTQGAGLNIIPPVITAYAGIPFTVTIAGGSRPYILGSSDPAVFPVPNTLATGGSFDVIPAQPGVVDTGLQPGELPRRSGSLTARDTTGFVATATFSVGQNFLVGYGVSYTNLCPPPATGQAQIQACNGSQTVVTVSPTFNGILRGNALVRFERLRGTFGFVQCASPPPVNPTLVNSITTNTDHEGKATVCLQPASNSATQLATYRVIDVVTGVYVDQVFTIVGGPASGALTVIPSTITLTGSGGRCGSGSSNFTVFDGTTPYTAVSSNPTLVSVVPAAGSTNTFTVTVFAQQPPCPTGNTVIVTDADGRRTTVTVDSAAGGTAPTMLVSPTSVTLTCGTSSSVTVIGGSGTYNATSTSPGLTATVSGNLVTITSVRPFPAAFPGPDALTTQTDSVTITDGTTITPVSVTHPTGCGP